MNKPMSAMEEDALAVIVSFCDTDGGITVPDVAIELGFSDRTAQRAVASLRRVGFVEPRTIRPVRGAHAHLAMLPGTLRQIMSRILEEHKAGRPYFCRHVAHEMDFQYSTAATRVSELRAAGFVVKKHTVWPTAEGRMVFTLGRPVAGATTAAQALVQHLVEGGHTHETIASIFGSTQRSVRRWLQATGSMPDNTLRELCEKLGVRLVYEPGAGWSADPVRAGARRAA